jgi:hypothetical protein
VTWEGRSCGQPCKRHIVQLFEGAFQSDSWSHIAKEASRFLAI